MYVIIIEPDHIVAKILKQELGKRNIKSSIAPSPAAAVQLADQEKPSLLITELSLSGHSTVEFLYEFRTYPDWQDIPVVVFSSLELEPVVLESRDWGLLAVNEVFYKPKTSVRALIDSVAAILEA